MRSLTLFNKKMNDKCPLQRQKGESKEAFDALVIYAEMGSERSLRGAYSISQGIKKGDKVPTRWGTWSRENNWQERVREYDNWYFLNEQDEKIRIRKHLLNELGDRLQDDLRKDLEAVNELREKWRTILTGETMKMTPINIRTMCAANKDIISSRKEAYETFMALTGINLLAEDFVNKEKKGN